MTKAVHSILNSFHSGVNDRCISSFYRLTSDGQHNKPAKDFEEHRLIVTYEMVQKLPDFLEELAKW